MFTTSWPLQIFVQLVVFGRMLKTFFCSRLICQGATMSGQIKPRFKRWRRGLA